MMENKKNLLAIILGLVLILICMVCLDLNYKKGVNDCVNAGHDIKWCQSELAK